MRFVASVSLIALAAAGCAANPPATGSHPPGSAGAIADSVQAATAPEDAAANALPFPLTPEGAQQFIAAAEADLGDFSVIGAKAAWVNATYITDDTDALSAYFGTIGTEKGVKYASQAARYAGRSAIPTARRIKPGRRPQLAVVTPGPFAALLPGAGRGHSGSDCGRARARA